MASDDYGKHYATGPVWKGVDHEAVPAAPWNARQGRDKTSIRCAHTFWLTAWDRVINGWGYIHASVSYQQSITIWL